MAVRDAVAGEHLAHGFDEFRFLHRELRRAALAPLLVGGDFIGGLGAEDEVLDLHLALRLLVAALDDDTRRVALVGVFQLRAHLALPKIKLGANAGVAQRRDHFLVVGDALLVEDGDDHGAKFGFGADLAEVLEGGEKARDADGESGRRHRLAAKARDEAVITPAAADRAEADGVSFFVLRFEGEFGFENGAGVIFEAADDGSINTYAVMPITCRFNDASN